MQNMAMKLILIVVLLGLFTWSMVARDFRLGKDLQGGVSLVYKVDVPEGADSNAVLQQVITVLQKRVNPKGVMDISMTPLGIDQIEIVMPLPDEEIQALRAALTEQLDAVVAKALIRADELDEAVAIGPDEVSARYGADPTTERGRRVQELVDAMTTLADAEQALADGEAAGLDEAELNKLRQAVADAEVDELGVENRISLLLETSLSSATLERVLKLSSEDRRVRNDETGEWETLDSQRTIEIDSLKSEFGHIAGDLDGLVTAYDDYQSKRKGFDDPEDLKRLLRGAGVLDFRIVVAEGLEGGAEGVNVTQMRTEIRERGPKDSGSAIAGWYRINKLEQWYDGPEELAQLQNNPETFFRARRNLVVERIDGEYYMLLYRSPTQSLTHETDDVWGIERTFRDVDNLGRPAVAFVLDGPGGILMGRLTQPNVGRPMAIVLDGEVYSAPTLQGQINKNGIITGSFSQEELTYLVNTLSAGSLSAQMAPDPIAESTIGPSIGADNLNRGMSAFIWALAAVAVFMIVYYFFAGIVAVFALVANGVIIFGMMKALDATFTLPGLAGIVLTIGMAVDANVLIYERIREEIFGGELDIKGAIREGYAKALSTIVDANVTNLIVCFVLFKTATTEVKGFAVTLSIGIVATLFTALFVTRQVYYIYTDVFGAKQLKMLPTVVPAIHRALEPALKWVSFRKVFWGLSTVLVLTSAAMIVSQGANMLDTEFRGGVSATVRLKDGLSATQAEIEERVQGLANLELDDPTAQMIVDEFENALVLTVGETTSNADGESAAGAFQIKVPIPKGLDEDVSSQPAVVQALSDEFGQELDVTLGLDFRYADTGTHRNSTFLINSDTMDELPGRNLRRFKDGVLVVVEDIHPAVTLDDVRSRIATMQTKQDFEEFSVDRMEVFGRGTPEEGDAYSSIAVAITTGTSYRDIAIADEQLAAPAWGLVAGALAFQSTLGEVNSFSPSVAQMLSANAAVAVILSLLGILAYIWVRFGSLRYSIAAIVALLHDVTIALGILAFTGIIGGTGLAALLLVEPFRIDLGVVAALLTIIGYSLNDTIVILDRIRENRGKRPLPTAAIVNRSINQTVSRTILTSVTTLIAVLIMYIAGGTGIRPFTFCLLVGLLVGTYSSVAIAAPLVLSGTGGNEPQGDEEEEYAAASAAEPATV